MTDREAVIIYYKCYFIPRIMPTVIYWLGTCGGAFQLEQREIALYFLRYDKENSTWIDFPQRQFVFRTSEEVAGELARDRWGSTYLVSLSMGPIFPGLHLDAQPLLADDAHPYDVFRMKPREFERAHAISAGIAAGFGEMVLDVDLDEKYDRTGVCNCGTERKVCDLCWDTFMRPAILVLLWMLRTYLGYRRIFTVFSGRRGFHMWICDSRVIRMSTLERQALVQILKGRSFTASREAGCEVDAFHQHVYEMLAPTFDGHPALRARYQEPADLHVRADHHRRAVFQALWPRLDEAVAADSTHLHKLPLTFHPTTHVLCKVLCEDQVNPRWAFKPSRHSYRASLFHNTDSPRLIAIIDACVATIQRALREEE